MDASIIIIKKYKLIFFMKFNYYIIAHCYYMKRISLTAINRNIFF